MSYLRTPIIDAVRSASRSGFLRLGAAVLVAFAVGSTSAEVAAAPVGYVYYFRSFDQWTVICGRDEAGGHDNCTLSAPPPEIHGAESQIEIGHGPGEKAAVTMRVRGTLMPESPFYLRVDARPPHQTMPNRFGEGGWSGAEAQTIIDELNAGQQVVVRWFVGPPPSPRDEMLSLNGFDEAMADLAAKIGSGPLSQSMPPPAPANSPPAAETAPAAPPTTVVAGEPEQAESDDTGAQPIAAPQISAASAQGPATGSGNGVSITGDHIARARLTSNVVNREPVDSLTSPITVTASGPEAIYFFTEVVDFAGRTVTHRWEYGGNVVASVPFQIGGERWRVYSRKSVAPGQTGTWTVTASAPDGTVLARSTFVLQ